MDMYELAQKLFGKNDANHQSGSTTTMYGTAANDSVDGRVDVVPDGEIIGNGSTAEVNMPTVVSVRKGDRVIITVVDGNPTVTGVVGYGDRTAEDYNELIQDLSDRADTAIDDAKRLAEEANEVATGTDQHFWSDDSGVHISNDGKNANGPHNILINSLGFLLRVAKNNLAAVTKSAITFYDGNGNGDSNILAHFGNDNATIGSYNGWHSKVDSGGFTIYDGQEGSDGLSNIIASFGKKAVSIGNGYSDAVIWFCNALGSIRQSVINGVTCLTMNSANVGLVGDNSIMLKSGNTIATLNNKSANFTAPNVMVIQGGGSSLSLSGSGIQAAADGHHLRIVPAYRLYNSYNGDHMWTLDDPTSLVASGWTNEGTIYLFASMD